jgi:hypothetical protein
MKNTILIINSKATPYNQLCHLKIGDYNGYLQGKGIMHGGIVSNGTRSNIITFYNRSLD